MDFSEIARVFFILVGLLVLNLITRRYIGIIVDRAVRSHRFASKAEERQREDTLTSLFSTIVTVILVVVAVVVVLEGFGVDLAALATGAGLIGIIVGFGAQSMIKDYLTGATILLEDQFRLGDIVTIAGHSGVVEHVSIRVTKLRDLDGSVYYVPNGEITTVQNMTSEFSNVVIDIGVGYDTDLGVAEKLINQVGVEMAEDEEWKDRIIEPVAFLRVDRFGDSGVYLKALGKVKPAEQWGIAGEYRKRLKMVFDDHGLEIPVPQRVIYDQKPESVKKNRK